MKKKFGHNEKVLCLIATLIFIAMLIVPVCAWEAWTSIDEIRAERAEAVHICEHCGSEVSG